MSATLSLRPTSPGFHRASAQPIWPKPCWTVTIPSRRTLTSTIVVGTGSRADDSAPIGMSVEDALKLLGVSEEASFDDILRAKNKVLATCKDDPQAVAQIEAAYDILLMQSLTRRQAGKVVNKSIRFADVKPAKSAGMPQWMQSAMKSSPVVVEKPPVSDLGVQAGVYGAMMVLTYINGALSSSAGAVTSADVPGVILATSFGASLYFMTKKKVKLGKAALITAGGLVVGAVVGSAVENWLQVDIVPFLGLHSPAAVISEFIILSQLLVSLYLSILPSLSQRHACTATVLTPPSRRPPNRRQMSNPTTGNDGTEGSTASKPSTGTEGSKSCLFSRLVTCISYPDVY